MSERLIYSTETANPTFKTTGANSITIPNLNMSIDTEYELRGRLTIPSNGAQDTWILMTVNEVQTAHYGSMVNYSGVAAGSATGPTIQVNPWGGYGTHMQLLRTLNLTTVNAVLGPLRICRTPDGKLKLAGLNQSYQDSSNWINWLINCWYDTNEAISSIKIEANNIIKIKMKT